MSSQSTRCRHPPSPVSGKFVSTPTSKSGEKHLTVTRKAGMRNERSRNISSVMSKNNRQHSEIAHPVTWVMQYLPDYRATSSVSDDSQ